MRKITKKMLFALFVIFNYLVIFKHSKPRT